MPVARPFRLVSAAALSLLGMAPAIVRAQVAADTAARSAMIDYQAECKADAGRLWGQSLCGPIVLVDPDTHQGIASIKPPGGAFVEDHGVWIGTLPPGIPISNTSLVWVGVAWAFVRLPVPDQRLDRVSLLLHESFHRIEDSLHLAGGDPMLPHLDEREGRYWLRLEIRAMKAALSAEGAVAKAAARDAMLFRARRVSLYPGSDTLEDLVERHEGMAEYTGTALALQRTGEPLSGTAHLFDGFEHRPTFVRSLGYGTGPGLGLLLDRYDSGWRKRLAGHSPALMLGTAAGYRPPADLKAEADRRAMAYGGGALAREEDARASRRQAELKDYHQRLVEGPVLELRQERLGRSFNPNTLVAFGAEGTIYPTGAFSADWGALTIDSLGGLVSGDYRLLRVSLPVDTSASLIRGIGWTLELKRGWKLTKGTRTGDLTVVSDAGSGP
jgi:hypothetical protein